MSRRYFNAAIETMSPDERRDFQVNGLKNLLKHAYTNCPAVRTKLDKVSFNHETVKSLEDLVRIPITTKDELRALQEKDPPFGGFLAIPLADVKTIFCSPGPIFEPEETSQAYDRWAKCFYSSRLGKGDIVLCTFTYNMVLAGMCAQLGANRLGATVIPAGPGNTELQVKLMRTLGVTAFLGHASFLLALIAKAEETGSDFRRDFRLRKALCAGEILAPSLRNQLKDYGVDVIQFYGSSDVGNFAYECREKNGFHICEETIVEIVDPVTKTRLGPGEVGEVVVTPLDARAYPLVRFGTGDLSSYTEEPCACGRTSNRLVRIVGRVGDAARIRGMFVHPKQVDEVLSRFAEVLQWSAIVTRPGQRDELTLKIELKPGVANTSEIGETISNEFPELCRVRPDRIEFVASGAITDDIKSKVVDKREWK